LREVGDERNKKEKTMRSRVVEGRSEVPAVFLE
jgi:inner membrane protease subunit 2